MAANVYEGMFILDSNKYARDPNGLSAQIDQLIKDHGGEVLVSRLWSEQKLAYPINGHRKGTYWLTYIKLESSKLDDLTYQCNINDDLLRFMFIKHDPRLVDTLVAHATDVATSDTPEESSEEEVAVVDEAEVETADVAETE